MISNNIQYPETSLQDQSILAKVPITADKLEFKIFMQLWSCFSPDRQDLDGFSAEGGGLELKRDSSEE
ncbi:hypothetical protein D1AOALGA4SA_4914 [Olavius algarvensis Delta 1 endosymbiont]|nr:hypothetical protein D1AOALGA4SA_4914 [Olavius algarvensis Delta 1 endosymbiont]